MPASKFAQKKVSVMSRASDVVKDRGAATFARVIDQQVSKPEQPLRNAGGNSDVLNFYERNVSCRSCNQAVRSRLLRRSECSEPCFALDDGKQESAQRRPNSIEMYGGTGMSARRNTRAIAATTASA